MLRVPTYPQFPLSLLSYNSKLTCDTICSASKWSNIVWGMTYHTVFGVIIHLICTVYEPGLSLPQRVFRVNWAENCSVMD